MGGRRSSALRSRSVVPPQIPCSIRWSRACARHSVRTRAAVAYRCGSFLRGALDEQLFRIDGATCSALAPLGVREHADAASPLPGLRLHTLCKGTKEPVSQVPATRLHFRDDLPVDESQLTFLRSRRRDSTLPARTMTSVTARRILGAGPDAPAHSIRAAQADLLGPLPAVRLPNLDDLRARGVRAVTPRSPRRTLEVGSSDNDER